MARRELSAADIYHKFAAQLDKDGFRLYHAAPSTPASSPMTPSLMKITRARLRQRTDIPFCAIWKQLISMPSHGRSSTGTTYEQAILGKVDTTTPEYRAFREAICKDALGRMGLGHLLKTKEKEVKEVGHER